MKGEDALMCHQCQRNDKGRVVWCLACKKKRYCVPCIERWCVYLLFDISIVFVFCVATTLG